RLAGRVDALPAPVPWTRSRRFDLLATGDAVRTHGSASVEMLFADASQLLLSEDSLVFLYDHQQEQRRRRSRQAPAVEIEVIEGQADLKNHHLPKKNDEGLEIVLGPARIRTLPDRKGSLETRARRTPGRASQVMVYRGAGEIAAAGAVLRLEEGRGAVIPASGKPSPPELLLPPPSVSSPAAGSSLETAAPQFLWQPVEGAAAYTFEICLDADCARLLEKVTDLEATSHRAERLAAGIYYWRVTAVAASGLDGYPSAPARLRLVRAVQVAEEARAGGPATISGLVRSRLGAHPLGGTLVRIPELAVEVRAGEDGRFEIPRLPEGTYAVEAHLPGFIVGREEGVAARAGGPTEVLLFLAAAPVIEEEIIVRPSRISLLQAEAVAPLALDREEILSLPHLGDDVLRALPLLPGTTSTDISAEFNVRGGRRDENMILLDGQELYSAFHLKDFDNALSIVAPASLASVELTTGGFPARFGDRMSGILEMTTTTPAAGRSYRLGASILSFQAGASGTLPGERGSWLALARRGSLDFAGRLIGGTENPSYWDGLAKGTLQLGSRHSLTGRVLHSDDALAFTEIDGEDFKNRDTHHNATYLWLTDQVLLGSKVFFDTFASWSDADSRRLALELESEQQFDLGDRRSFQVAELRQDWSFEAGGGHFL
ncbi:MAG: TonB-dependent receptor, partial [Acidobacteria bacterium]|nr:TonB-dependent receptor [Acidobacteriota bacterium]